MDPSSLHSCAATETEGFWSPMLPGLPDLSQGLSVTMNLRLERWFPIQTGQYESFRLWDVPGPCTVLQRHLPRCSASLPTLNICGCSVTTGHLSHPQDSPGSAWLCPPHVCSTPAFISCCTSKIQLVWTRHSTLGLSALEPWLWGRQGLCVLTHTCFTATSSHPGSTQKLVQIQL